jgi:sulfate permease, SulP family
MLTKIFPFLKWFKGYTAGHFKTDALAGLTVALVLIPQSMAYAQLAGLPAYYGLYASFLPPMVAALFGSSRQLATGPVAVVSLMTAASLEPLATAGSAGYITYAVLLALMVGAFQLTLGILRLGLVVNFLSHPVVNGFTNAAAIIIASSQLSKMFGVYVDSATHHYETIWRVMQAAVHFTHWPSLLMGVFAFALMYTLKSVSPRIPNVLVAVVLTTLIAWLTGFEHNQKVPAQAIASPQTRALIGQFNTTTQRIAQFGEERTEVSHKVSQAAESRGHHGIAVGPT